MSFAVFCFSFSVLLVISVFYEKDIENYNNCTAIMCVSSLCVRACVCVCVCVCACVCDTHYVI